MSLNDFEHYRWPWLRHRPLRWAYALVMTLPVVVLGALLGAIEHVSDLWEEAR